MSPNILEIRIASKLQPKGRGKQEELTCLGLDPKEEEICRSKKLQVPDGSRTDPQMHQESTGPRDFMRPPLKGRRPPGPGLLSFPWAFAGVLSLGRGEGLELQKLE